MCLGEFKIAIEKNAISALRARERAENWQQNRKLGEEELTAHLAEIEGYFIQVRRVKEKLLQELESVEEQNKTYRDKAINST